MSKKFDDSLQLTKKLEGLGLSEKESKVYLSLLPYRDIGSSKLIRATGLHGQFVYNALTRLEELGLARHVIKNGRKKFSANTPNRLLSLVEEKRLTTQSIVRELQDRFAGKHEQDFEVYQGDVAFMSHQMNILRNMPNNTVWCAIASAADRYRQVVENLGFLEELDTLRREKNITIRYLGVESRRVDLSEREKNWFNWTYKILPGLGVGIIGIEIFPESVSFVVYGDEILCFTLSSKEVADGYRDFFESLWKLSSK
ncbi:hypothetical protein HY971_02860 [Candidatus Kaiserbacteria bacterium]|nr:hypothetical protein [Candidatus Kaiserbacteria bacterium]